MLAQRGFGFVGAGLRYYGMGGCAVPRGAHVVGAAALYGNGR